jgi:hypothetical protein
LQTSSPLQLEASVGPPLGQKAVLVGVLTPPSPPLLVVVPESIKLSLGFVDEPHAGSATNATGTKSDAAARSGAETSAMKE